MLLLAVGWLVTAQAFFSPSAPIRVSGYPPTKSTLTSKTRDTHATGNFNSYTLGCMRGSGSSSEQAAATDTGVSLLASNDNSSSFIDATFLAERIPLESTTPASNYQITRPRWYNKNEAGIIVLLVQRLRLLDVRGVEHMLEAVDAYREVDTDDVLERALFLMKIAPGANFRTVIARHPRTLLVPRARMKRVCEIISDAFPGANMARIVERIPSIFSRNATRLERNIQGIKDYVPEVDSAIFQAAPSMMYIPPNTIKEKVEALRHHLPGVNLYTVMKGMPTVLSRSSSTVPRGLDALRERFPSATDQNLVRLVEAAPGLMRMSGVNGTLDVKVSALTDLLPGVNVTNVFSNAPGVLIRSLDSLPAKVNKLETLFPSANVTKMVSRTPGILYLDIDRTIKPKALWIKEVVGLDQDGLDTLVETGPWLLKAGWGPLARLEFAIHSGLGGNGDKMANSLLVGLVRRSRVAFAAAHHPAYANFLRKRLQDEEGEGKVLAEGGGADSDGEFSVSATSESAFTTTDETGGSGGDKGIVEGLEGDNGAENGDEQDLMEATFKEVGQLEDCLGRWRKARLGGVKDRPPNLGRVRSAPIGSIELKRIEDELDARRAR